MDLSGAKSLLARFAVCLACVVAAETLSPRAQAAGDERLSFPVGKESVRVPRLPFNQAAVKQIPASTLPGADPKTPFFHVRFALPIPPENRFARNGTIAGLDPSVMGHLHSPGFEILPNGDAL